LTRGNSEIVPERSKELEFGVDVQILDGKVGLEATIYNKTVEDLIIPANVATSQGFAVQVFNAGDLENKGVELALKVNPVQTTNFSWNAGISWWRNRSEMTRLDIPAFTKGSFASALGIFKIEEGKSVTQIVGPVPGSEGDVVIGDAEPDFQMSWYNEISFLKNFDFRPASVRQINISSSLRIYTGCPSWTVCSTLPR
jgi:outer membrane receptor protein involved in Fe transport